MIKLIKKLIIKLKSIFKRSSESENYDLLLKVPKITKTTVYFEYPKYNWPEKKLNVVVDAKVCMYLSDGRGGQFDWIRKGGQSSKGLEHITKRSYGVFKSLPVPGAGDTVYFRWESVDGKLSSNRVKVKWP